jgi:hypothetical protein
MRRLRIVAVLMLCAQTAWAAPLDDIYDERELIPLQGSYLRGWRNNFDNVFAPRFTEEERRRLARVEFKMERRVPGFEPFAFLYRRDLNQVIVSAASLLFLEDVMYAYAWLNVKGYEIQSVGDYLMMLRYWDPGRGRPPKPLDALCIKRDPADQKVSDFAARGFNMTAVFAMLHEYGHAFHGHEGNAAVVPAVSRTNEEAADRFALDVIARTGEVPIGVTELFFIMAYLFENRADFASDAAYQQTLGARTHPLSPQRLQAFAQHLSSASGAYAQAFKPGAKASAMLVAQMVQGLSLRVADEGTQRLSAMIGRTVSQDDLAPRQKGVHLAPPCKSRQATGQGFDGYHRGEVVLGRTSFPADAVLERFGDAVSGSYSYGAGFGRIRGNVKGDSLSYRWSLGRQSGNGVLTLQNGNYRGTFGSGAASSGEGTIALSKAQ